MSNRYIKFIPSQEAMYLVVHKPNAFRLLTIIAQRARWKDGHPDGLKPGQCHLGDWESYGFSEQEYRTAKKVLEKRQHLKIIETCRTRKKSTTGVTTTGTLVQIISLTVYDINIIDSNDRINDCLTTEQRPPNDELESIKNDKESCKKETISKPSASSVVSRSFPLSTELEKEVDYFDEICKRQGFAFQSHVLKRWAEEYGISYVSDIFQILLKQVALCEAKPDKKPILKPEAWMEKALNKNYIAMGEIAQKNMELAMKLRHSGWPNLEVKTRYAVDNSTGKEFMYNYQEFEKIIMVEFERVKEG